MKPELLVLLHVGLESGECEVLNLVDTLYFRCNGVEDAVVVFRGCVACSSCLSRSPLGLLHPHFSLGFGVYVLAPRCQGRGCLGFELFV